MKCFMFVKNKTLRSYTMIHVCENEMIRVCEK